MLYTITFFSLHLTLDAVNILFDPKRSVFFFVFNQLNFEQHLDRPIKYDDHSFESRGSSGILSRNESLVNHPNEREKKHQQFIICTKEEKKTQLNEVKKNSFN